ncbi:PAS domain-containing protein [Streptomyces sp. T1317-0309]|nr:PAS domain-containing protein [Streptomyces sp. T1317-0309]
MTMGASHATERGGHPEVAHPEDPAAHIIVDDRGTVAGWSSAAQRLLGYSVHAMLGRPVTDLLADAGPPTYPRPADDAFAVRLRHADGAVVSCQVGIRPERTGQAGTRWQVTLACAQEESPTAELDHALLDTLFTASPVGLYLLDPELRIIRFNPAAEGMENTSMAEAVGRRPTEVWPDFAVEMVERIMEQVRDTRQSAIAVEKRMYPRETPATNMSTRPPSSRWRTVTAGCWASRTPPSTSPPRPGQGAAERIALAGTRSRGDPRRPRHRLRPGGSVRAGAGRRHGGGSAGVGPGRRRPRPRPRTTRHRAAPRDGPHAGRGGPCNGRRPGGQGECRRGPRRLPAAHRRPAQRGRAPGHGRPADPPGHAPLADGGPSCRAGPGSGTCHVLPLGSTPALRTRRSDPGRGTRPAHRGMSRQRPPLLA